MRQINRYPLLAAVLLAVIFSACDLNISFGDSPSSSAAASFSASSAPAPKLADRPKEEKAESSGKAEEEKQDGSDPWDDPNYGKDWFSSEDYEDPDIPEDFELFDPWNYDDFDSAPYDGNGKYDPLKDN